ncbi:unnamed protein product [Mytilus coruscus]|uniref:Integrase catalytic domain-containing protein n=1 Tax=Mytilus coruscus TaxID=42192 RepID=A0A6J8A3D7_MYTCO|nr:unnamed protein product [Mytilus coruscus]
MANRINLPSFSKSKSYELYKQELVAWSEITDLDKKKRGIAVALTLPEDDESKIREKDDLADSLEKFEDFTRPEGQSIHEYVANFDSKYRKIEKKNMKLPSEILAFKLLRKANIIKEEKMLVLTGMNYENKLTLYEEAKCSLKKFKGEGGQVKDIGQSIKIESTFLAKNEEALWAAGYVKRGSSYNYKRGGRYSRGGGRGQGFQSSQRGAKNLNPTGPDGKPLTCRSCGSYRHLVAKCPDSFENLSKVNITEEEEHAVLFTGYQKQDIKQLGNDARNCAVLDSTCSSTVCGKTWLNSYISSLNEEDREKFVNHSGHKVFKFGGGTRLKSVGEYDLPICMVGEQVKLKTDVVDSDIPLLLSRSAMKRAGVKMDLENDMAIIMEKEVSLNLTSSGHYCIPIDKTEMLKVEEVNAFSIDETQKDAGIWKEEYDEDLSEIQSKCELCKMYAVTPPRLVVSVPMAKQFNEKVPIDLKQYKDRWILHMVDMWSRYTVSVFINRKKPTNVIEALVKNWVGIFGVMGALISDNGGEFSSDEMREVASILNVKVCTTAGMSPYQNGLCECVHAITDII